MLSTRGRPRRKAKKSHCSEKISDNEGKIMSERSSMGSRSKTDKDASTGPESEVEITVKTQHDPTASLPSNMSGQSVGDISDHEITEIYQEMSEQNETQKDYFVKKVHHTRSTSSPADNRRPYVEKSVTKSVPVIEPLKNKAATWKTNPMYSSSASYKDIYDNPVEIEELLRNEPAQTLITNRILDSDRVREALESKISETGEPFYSPQEITTYVCMKNNAKIIELQREDEMRRNEVLYLQRWSSKLMKASSQHTAVAHGDENQPSYSPPWQKYYIDRAQKASEPTSLYKPLPKTTDYQPEPPTDDAFSNPENSRFPRRGGLAPETIRYQLILDITPFEGEENRPLSEFKREFQQIMPDLVNCTVEGKPASEEDDYNLARFIRMRIKGHALEFLHSFAGKKLLTSKDIWRHLKHRYSSFKDRQYYQVQLRNLRQGDLSVTELAHEVLKLSKGFVASSPNNRNPNVPRQELILQTAFDNLWGCLSDSIMMGLFPQSRLITDFYGLVNESRRVENQLKMLQARRSWNRSSNKMLAPLVAGIAQTQSSAQYQQGAVDELPVNYYQNSQPTNNVQPTHNNQNDQNTPDFQLTHERSYQQHPETNNLLNPIHQEVMHATSNHMQKDRYKGPENYHNKAYPFQNENQITNQQFYHPPPYTSYCQPVPFAERSDRPRTARHYNFSRPNETMQVPSQWIPAVTRRPPNTYWANYKQGHLHHRHMFPAVQYKENIKNWTYPEAMQRYHYYGHERLSPYQGSVRKQNNKRYPAYWKEQQPPRWINSPGRWDWNQPDYNQAHTWHNQMNTSSRGLNLSQAMAKRSNQSPSNRQNSREWSPNALSTAVRRPTLPHTCVENTN